MVGGINEEKYIEKAFITTAEIISALRRLVNDRLVSYLN